MVFVCGTFLNLQFWQRSPETQPGRGDPRHGGCLVCLPGNLQPSTCSLSTAAGCLFAKEPPGKHRRCQGGKCQSSKINDWKLIFILAFPPLFFYQFDPLKNSLIAVSIENKLKMFAPFNFCPRAKFSVQFNFTKILICCFKCKI